MKPLCRHCQNDKYVKLRRRITGDGTPQVYWYCLACERGAQDGEPSIKQSRVMAMIAPHTLDEIPIAIDYTQDSPPCVICGDKDTQFNHWCPQHFADNPEIAPDWNAWANVGAPLCKRHHSIWHHIVTPYLPGIGADRKHEP